MGVEGRKGSVGWPHIVILSTFRTLRIQWSRTNDCSRHLRRLCLEHYEYLIKILPNLYLLICLSSAVTMRMNQRLAKKSASIRPALLVVSLITLRNNALSAGKTTSLHEKIWTLYSEEDLPETEISLQHFLKEASKGKFFLWTWVPARPWNRSVLRSTIDLSAILQDEGGKYQCLIPDCPDHFTSLWKHGRQTLDVKDIVNYPWSLVQHLHIVNYSDRIFNRPSVSSN